jgi:putative ABC transport system ATP-binding protein
LEKIEQCNLDFGALVVLVTHNTVIAGVADRVLTLADGAIADARTNMRRRRASELSW